MTLSPTHSRPAECGSGQAIQARPDHPNRVVSPSRGLPLNLQQVAPAQIDLFAEVQQQVASVCVTGTGSPGHSSGYTQYAMVGSESIHLPTISHIGQVVEKLQDSPCKRNILIAPGWPNMPWFWDLVAMSSHIPLSLPNLSSLFTAIRSDPSQKSDES